MPTYKYHVVIYEMEACGADSDTPDEQCIVASWSDANEDDTPWGLAAKLGLTGRLFESGDLDPDFCTDTDYK